MKVAVGRPLQIFCVSTIIVVILGGCTVGQKSFSMDSNSRVPFFGLELWERKPKNSSPTFNSISRTQSDRSHVETAVQVSPSASNGLGKANRISRVAVVGMSDSASNLTITSQNDTKSQPLVSIPIPMSDQSQNVTDRQAETSSLDFQ